MSEDSVSSCCISLSFITPTPSVFLPPYLSLSQNFLSLRSGFPFPEVSRFTRSSVHLLCVMISPPPTLTISPSHPPYLLSYTFPPLQDFIHHNLYTSLFPGHDLSHDCSNRLRRCSGLRTVSVVPLYRLLRNLDRCGWVQKYIKR
jgi:hypothetical protein